MSLDSHNRKLFFFSAKVANGSALHKQMPDSHDFIRQRHQVQLRESCTVLREKFSAARRGTTRTTIHFGVLAWSIDTAVKRAPLCSCSRWAQVISGVRMGAPIRPAANHQLGYDLCFSPCDTDGFGWGGSIRGLRCRKGSPSPPEVRLESDEIRDFSPLRQLRLRTCFGKRSGGGWRPSPLKTLVAIFALIWRP